MVTIGHVGREMAVSVQTISGIDAPEVRTQEGALAAVLKTKKVVIVKKMVDAIASVEAVAAVVSQVTMRML